jgi:CRISPR-associated protein Cas5d
MGSNNQQGNEDWHVEVRISADRACYTVPAFGGERRTYPFPTPSALEGVLESVFWKPEISYEIASIGVLCPGTEVAITRSELQARQSARSGSAGEQNRTLRTTAYLRDVDYLVRVRIVRHAHCRPTDTLGKYQSQLIRRLERGSHFQTPYLGLREFPAKVALSDGLKVPSAYLNADLGPVFFGHA